MKTIATRLSRFAALIFAITAIFLAPLLGSASASAATMPAHAVAAPVAPSQVAPATAADGTPQGAVEWYQQHDGDTSYEGYCEMAVENAYGTTGVWPSAIDHWNAAVNAGAAHPGDTNPPVGAFVYWNISSYGHVGISDGNGGFYSSSIQGAIGHRDSVSYFSNYLGWSRAQVPSHG